MEGHRKELNGRYILAITLLLAGCASMPSSQHVPGITDGKLALQSTTLPEAQFPTISRTGEPTTVWAELKLPGDHTGAVPAVVLVHGCGGMGASHRRWAAEFMRLGYASLLIDSFGGRAIKETCTGKQRINLGSRINDAYRGLDFLASHPRVDPGKIALMGFSQGGGVTLLARYTRFQRLWMTAGRSFVAYLAFYPATCNRRLIDESEVSSQPLRIFHGVADDWTPVGPCREYVERMRQGGKDVALFAYPSAHHGFDNRNSPPERSRPDVLNSKRCVFVEQPNGRFAVFHKESGTRVTPDSPCITHGATTGYHSQAYRQSIDDVKTFLESVFKNGKTQDIIWDRALVY
jgi:dienelactone hydrolase